MMPQRVRLCFRKRGEFVVRGFLRIVILLICVGLLFSATSAAALAGKVADTTGATTFYGVLVGYDDDGYTAAK